MEQIAVNEYVRTTDGIIDQIENYDAILDIYFCKGGMSVDKLNMIGTHLTNIVKHSPRLIDLIEKRRLCKRLLCIQRFGRTKRIFQWLP